MRIAWIIGALCVARAAEAKDAARDEIADLVAAQIDAASDQAEPADAKAPYADGATIVVTDSVHASTPILAPDAIRLDRIQKHDDKHLDIQLSRDGQTAWVSVETTVSLKAYGHDLDTHAANEMEWTVAYRISDVVAKVGGKWKVLASAWSESVDNAKANAAAKSKHPPRLEPVAGAKPDATMEGELVGWQSGDVNTTIAKAAIVFGSGERTTDGPGFRKAWYASWAGHVAVEAQKLGALSPSGTTGWVIANLMLDKKSYKVPFRIFAMFDKDAAGKWQLVHAHLATPG